MLSHAMKGIQATTSFPSWSYTSFAFLGRIRTVPRVCCRGWHDVFTTGRLGASNPPSSSSLPRFLQRYQRLLHHQPKLCTFCSATCTAVVGDLIAQALAAVGACEQIESVESPLARACTYGAVSGILVGGIGELWYRSLLKSFPGATYEAALRAILDLSLFAPVTLGLFVCAVAICERSDLEYVRYRLDKDWGHSIGKMWVLWGVGTTLSYLHVQPPWQPPLAMVLACVWHAFVSLRIHQPWQKATPRDAFRAQYLRDNRRNI